MTQQVVVPALGESITEAVIAKIHKKSGEQINADELLFELETDKVTLEVNSPAAGSISSIEVNEGDEVLIGQLLANIEEGEVANVSTKAQDTIIEDNVKLWEKQDAPSAKKLMNENNIKRSDVKATGKKERITKVDINKHLAQKTQLIDRDSITVQTPEHRVRRVKMSKLRKKIAERLKESQNTAAILTTFNEINMKNVIEVRAKYQDEFQKKYSVKLGFMSFFVKAVIAALSEAQNVNAEILNDEIIYKDYYDIGVAVGTKQGLVVPVVRNAGEMSLAEIESEIFRLSSKAREGKLILEEMQGGTFTISNGGVYGSLLSTPIINPPQSGILGMHSIQNRAVVIDDKIEIRPMMYTALSYDHRIVDGKEAVTFLVKLKQYIEDPQRLILKI